MDINALTDQFVAQYKGTHIDEDGYYGAQCWDVVARFAREKIGCPSFPTGSGGAEGLYRIFAQPIPQYFAKLSAGEAKKGDIGVCPASFSPPWGHTFLILSRSGNSMQVLEQNGNNPGGNCYITTRYVSDMSGILRAKGATMASKPSITTLRIGQSEIAGSDFGFIHSGQFDAQMVAAWGEWEVNDYIYKMWQESGQYRQTKATWKAFYDQYSPQIQQLLNSQKALSDANAQIVVLTNQIAELGKRPDAAAVKALQDQATAALEAAKKAQADLEKANAQAAADQAAGDSFLRRLGQFIKKYLPGGN